MLDLIGAIAGTAAYAVLVGTLVGLAPADTRQKWTVLAAAAAWGTAIVAVTALGGMAPGAIGPVPGPGLAFVGLMGLLLASWFLAPTFRAGLLARRAPVGATSSPGWRQYRSRSHFGAAPSPRPPSRRGTSSAPSTSSSRCCSACCPLRTRRSASSPRDRALP